MPENRLLTAVWLVLLAALGWTSPVQAQADGSGCTDVWACNFDPLATEDDGSCDYQSCIGCTNQYACNYDTGAIYNDGSCEYLSCVGCMVAAACNFDPEALIPNQAECDFESCVGCTDFTACSYDPEATLSDPSQCTYPLPNLDCAGNPTGCGGCEPIFVTDYSAVSVECADALPLEPIGDMLAVSGCSDDTLDVSTFVIDASADYTLNVGTTADGIGPDGAIRVFGLTALGLANSDYFVETYPLLVSRYANGVAIVNGQVQNTLNPNLVWNVHLVLEDPRSGEEWLSESPSHGFVTAFGCSMDTANTTTYRLNSEHSFLIGAGGYEGSYLQLSHMPFNESKRFQLGEGGNSVNCNYGFGGWFAWSGRVLGESVSGMTGDLVIDLGEDIQTEVSCGEEMTIHFHHALNEPCGKFTEVAQVFQRVDTASPEWIDTENACVQEVVLCFDEITGETALPAPCAFLFEDGCGEAVDATWSDAIVFGDPVTAPGEPFAIERTYSGTDCSGNVGSFVQTLTFDGDSCPEAPLSPVEKPRADKAPASRQATAEAINIEHPSLLGNLAPNPTSSSSVLTVHVPQDGLLTLEVFDLTGKRVRPLHSIFGNDGTEQRVLLSAEGMASGYYLVRAECQGIRETLRWAVQH